MTIGPLRGVFSPKYCALARFGVPAVALAAIAPLAAAADFTARNPVAPVLFTIDNESPTAQMPGGLIRGADILRHPGPVLRIARNNLGLPNAANHVDAISFDRNISATAVFVIRFSVDRASSGGAPPDGGLAGSGFPFNASQQALLNQAGGDDFISLRQFRRTGILPLLANEDRGGNNNTLTHNQGDAGGVDYSLLPNSSPDAPNPGDEDDLKGGAAEPTGAIETGITPLFFFSVSRSSPGLTSLPGSTGSGADIFVDLDTDTPGGQQLYLAPSQLGLAPLDEIDALIVFEDGVPGFNPNSDQLLFSLARGSPSLPMRGWSPADVLTTRTGGQLPTVFAQAAQLGLGTSDELDMLEVDICVDVDECVQDWAIGKQPTAVPATTGLGALVGIIGLAAIGAGILRRAVK